MEQAKSDSQDIKKATFAGGCFWCMEKPYESYEGIVEVISGYTGGKLENPTYGEVSSGSTDHVEAVQVTYDVSKISYTKLLDIFWRQIDPTDPGGQFADRGHQYSTAIFYHDKVQKQLAEQSKQDLEGSRKFDKPIVTKIIEATPFFDAEEYHQDYYKKNSAHYQQYRSGSGRDRFIEKHWGDAKKAGKEKAYSKPTDSELKNSLTALQYSVTQNEGTEPPFQNEYWDNKKAGLYVDVVSGEPLFSSTDKFKSGTGWPSFFRPIDPRNVYTDWDESWGLRRREVLCSRCDGRLGRVFKDEPSPTSLRYCLSPAPRWYAPQVISLPASSTSSTLMER